MSYAREAVLDDLDLQIMQLLAQDGRKSFAEMGRTLNVPLGRIRNRFLKLRERNILHVIGWVDPRELGFQAPAGIMIKVRLKDLEDAIEEIGKLPEVEFLARITGEYNLMADIICRDLDHLHEFLSEKLQRIKGVEDVWETLYLKHHKPISAAPLFSITRVIPFREITQVE